MKKIFVVALSLFCHFTFAQEHFSGISTSNRVGILNVNINPAELTNLSKKFEVNIFGLSVNVANDKLAFSDFNSDTDFEELLFSGTSPVNARVHAEINGLGFAMRWKKWGLAITSKAYAKFDLVDIDPTIGNAITNNNIGLNTTLLDNKKNQRMNGTSYGEIGFSLARTLVDKEKHKFSAGVTLKLLFPGSYSNFGLSNLNGTITEVGGDAFLTTNSPATLNIAYSGNLADSFTNFDDYSKSIFGGLNGFSGDVGANYQWLGDDKKYKLNAGLSIRNIGSMTFKDNNNASTNYSLNIPNSDPLDLSLFEDVDSLSDVEDILSSNGYLTVEQGEKDFKVKLPTVFSTYVDLKVIHKLYVTAYLQQKLNDDSANEQVTAPNIFSITPRISLRYFETYIPVTFHEISGTNVGFGFRLGGFYLGSSSMVTALLADSKQGDIYLGFRWGFL
ncbi:hypothetical protein [Flavobacterium dankookense]|uniref:DUF5723 domain-containing protein n=1 Tax=Flavobacterium dankookense TaxID=706186 RepID=A0A4V3CSH5_9FLAO|nr:hypothetical protein [Flavobacterium dankookense]TDP60692.1 hypothetical protein BC748_0288 [Flavobacterium dankookense]